MSRLVKSQAPNPQSLRKKKVPIKSWLPSQILEWKPAPEDLIQEDLLRIGVSQLISNLQTLQVHKLKHYFPNTKGSRLCLTRAPLSQKLLLLRIESHTKFWAASKNVQNAPRLRARGALLGTDTSAFGWSPSWLSAPASWTPLPWPCLFALPEHAQTHTYISCSYLNHHTRHVLWGYVSFFMHSSLPLEWAPCG